MEPSLQPVVESEGVLEDKIPEVIESLDDIETNVKQVNDLITNLQRRVDNGELSTDSGLSFLEIKYQLMLTYLTDLMYVVLRKTSGVSIQNDPIIENLVTTRVIMEKVRPIDYKLRYQVDKLVKAAISGDGGTNDLTSFKANPKKLLSAMPGDGDASSASEDESDDETTRKQKKEKRKSSNIYVPPKLTAVQYDGDETKETRAQNRMDRARKLALNSSIIQDLKEEYLDTPLEITSSSRAQKMHTKAQREKEDYEEQYLTRLPITKAEKRKQRNLSTIGKLGAEITSFGDISALEGHDLVGDDEKSGGKRKKRPMQGGGNKKKKFGNKKRRFN